jgi:hypothetical protein
MFRATRADRITTLKDRLMTKQDRDFGAEKADRALVFHEQGMSRATIAERLCVRPIKAKRMIEQAKQRREKKVGELSNELSKMSSSAVIFQAEQRAEAKWHIVCHCPDGKIGFETRRLRNRSQARKSRRRVETSVSPRCRALSSAKTHTVSIQPCFPNTPSTCRYP